MLHKLLSTSNDQLPRRSVEEIKLSPIRLTDNDLVYSGLVTMATVGNTRSYGGGMEVCPKADHHDGLLDLSLLTNFDRVKMLRNMSSVAAGTWWKLDCAKMFRGEKIRIEMLALTAYADGDPFFGTPIECSVAPDAGYYIVPRP